MLWKLFSTLAFDVLHSLFRYQLKSNSLSLSNFLCWKMSVKLHTPITTRISLSLLEMNERREMKLMEQFNWIVWLEITSIAIISTIKFNSRNCDGNDSI